MPSVDLATLAIQIPLETLGALLLTAVGQRIWKTIAAIARRRRHPHPTTEANHVVVALHDSRTRIRLDLTLNDLTDDRLQAELASLSEIAKTAAPVVLRWNAATAGWHAQTPDSSS
jgi:hypothetical protein